MSANLKREVKLLESDGYATIYFEWKEILATSKKFFQHRNILISEKNTCYNFFKKSDISHCKLGYFLGRAHATMGILSAVISNCKTVYGQKSFFLEYGNYLFKSSASILELARSIDNARTESLYGKEWGDINNKGLMKVILKLYLHNIQKFSDVWKNDLPRVCQNFRSKIQKGELTIELELDRYLREFKKSYPKKYQESHALVRSLMESLTILRNFRTI